MIQIFHGVQSTFRRVHYFSWRSTRERLKFYGNTVKRHFKFYGEAEKSHFKFYGKAENRCFKFYGIIFFLNFVAINYCHSNENQYIRWKEVKSSGYTAHKSLDEFRQKFSARIKRPVVLYPKDLKNDGETLYLPAYMASIL